MTPCKFRQLVRQLVSVILEHCENPSKKELANIAQNMVEKYSALLDKDIKGNIIESGYTNLLYKLVNRVGNTKREKSKAEGGKEIFR